MDHPEGASETGDGRLGLVLIAGCGWNFVARSSVRTAVCW